MGVAETLDHILGLGLSSWCFSKAENGLLGMDGLFAWSLVFHLQLANEHFPLLVVPAAETGGKIEQRYRMIECTAGDVQVEEDSSCRAPHTGIVASEGHQTASQIEGISTRMAVFTQESRVWVKLVAWKFGNRLGFVGSFAHDDVEHLYQVLVACVVGLRGGRIDEGGEIVQVEGPAECDLEFHSAASSSLPDMPWGVGSRGLKNDITSFDRKYNLEVSPFQKTLVELLGSDDGRGEVSGVSELLECRHLENLLNGSTFLRFRQVVVGVVDGVAMERLFYNLLVEVMNQLHVEVVGAKRDRLAFDAVGLASGEVIDGYLSLRC